MSLGVLLSVALLGPEGSPVIARLQRNFADEPVVTSVAVSCTRTVIAQAAAALDGNTIICTDGDVVTVWKAEPDGVRLVDAVPIGGTDDHTLEVVAARVTLAARSSINGPVPIEGGDGSITIYANPSGLPPPPASPPLLPPSKPRLPATAIFSAGPGVFSSASGGSVGFQLQGDIGVGRLLALSPWVGIIPAPRHVAPAAASAYGTADYRPTLFGFGITIPVLRPDSVVIPRIGAGYALLWIHTWPDKVGPAGIANEPENLFAPVTYVTAAVSVRIVDRMRIVLEGMFGLSTSEAEIRVGGDIGARWGIPLADASLRAEYMIP